MNPRQVATHADEKLAELVNAQEDVTVKELTLEAHVSIGCARAAIKRALDAGTIQLVGYEETGKRGRPPALYGKTEA